MAGMTVPTTFADRDAALAFIAAQQDDPATACAFVDTLAEGLEGDLDGFEQPWMQTLRVVTDPSGALTGAVVLEWDADDDVSMSWVHGPWTTPDTWQRDARALLESAVAQAPVRRHQIYGPTANVRLAALGESLGWRGSRINRVLTIERCVLARPDVGVRAGTHGDLPGVTALHDAAFPGAYASAAELIDPGSRYRTLVIADPAGDAGIHGYLAGHVDEQGGYLDFMAVHPQARRNGLASRLMGAWADGLDVEQLRLTVSDGSVEARALYARQGWTELSATRSWTSPEAG